MWDDGDGGDGDDNNDNDDDGDGGDGGDDSLLLCSVCVCVCFCVMLCCVAGPVLPPLPWPGHESDSRPVTTDGALHTAMPRHTDLL